MIENLSLERDNRRRRWLRPAAGLAAIIALSAATGWAVASLAAPTAAPDMCQRRGKIVQDSGVKLYQLG